MPTLIFLPSKTTVEVEPNTKILAAATKAKVPIRYGCGALRCGTCGIETKPESSCKLSPMDAEEKAMLEKLELNTDGTIRMACRTRIMEGTCSIDLDFQDEYTP